MTERQVKKIIEERFNVSRETLKKIEEYEKLLLKWNKRINLISAKTEVEVWERHILDSLQLIPHVSGTNVLDIGSGGGLPAIILSICLGERVKIVCVDSDFRKCAFLNAVKLALNLNVDVKCCRVEELLADDVEFDLITARGFKSIKEMLPALNKLKCKGVFLKGGKCEDEVCDAQSLFSFKFELFDSITHRLGKIIAIEDVQRVVSL